MAERCLGPHLERVAAALRARPAPETWRYRHLLVLLRELQLLTETIEDTPAPAGVALCRVEQQLEPVGAPLPAEAGCNDPPDGPIVRSRSSEIVRGFLDGDVATSARDLAYEVAPRPRSHGWQPCECSRRFLSGLQLAAAAAIVDAPTAAHRRALTAFAVGVEGLMYQAEVVDDTGRQARVNGVNAICAALPVVRPMAPAR